MQCNSFLFEFFRVHMQYNCNDFTGLRVSLFCTQIVSLR